MALKWWTILAAVVMLLVITTEPIAACLGEHYKDPITIQIICPQRTLTYTGKNTVPQIAQLRSEDLAAVGCPAEPAHLQQLTAEYDRWIIQRRRFDSTFLGSPATFHSHVPGELTFIPWSATAAESTAQTAPCLELVDRRSGAWLVRGPRVAPHCTEDPALVPSARYNSCGEITTSLVANTWQLRVMVFLRYHPWSLTALPALAAMALVSVAVAWWRGLLRDFLQPSVAKALLTLSLVCLWRTSGRLLLHGFLPGVPIASGLAAIFAELHTYVWTVPCSYVLVCVLLPVCRYSARVLYSLQETDGHDIGGPPPYGGFPPLNQ